MLSEDFDKKIRDAAENHHPAYREEAWKNMSRLLGKHLPEKEKERKRFLWFFLLFAGLLAGSVIILLPKARKNYQVATEKTSGEFQPVIGNEVEGNKKQSVSKMPINQGEVNSPTMNTEVPETTNPSRSGSNSSSIALTETKTKLSTNETLSLNYKQAIESKRRIDRGSTTKKTKRPAAGNKTKSSTTGSVTGDLTENTLPDSQGSKFVQTTNPPEAINEQPLSTTESKTEEQAPAPLTEHKDTKDAPGLAMNKTTESDSTMQQVVPSPERKGKPSFGSKWSLVLSAGPDLSFASGNAGRLETVKGVGIGYQINERFSLRTGFYTARKIYTAEAKDYKFTGTVGNYYPNLKSVDGDCIVYEIPLLLNYNFVKGDRSSWFVSGGLSTLLMHQEEYNYYYKPWPTGSYVHKKWAVSDKNKHYFSLVALSAGYTRKLNERLYIQAEPYMRLPLNGVGEGKIELKSAGVLFSIGFKPWK